MAPTGALRRDLRAWWTREPLADGTWQVAAFGDDRHPDRTVLDLADLAAQDRPDGIPSVRVTYAPATLQLLTAVLDGPALAAGAPALVLVERVDRDAQPVTTELVAFAHEEVAARGSRLGTAVAPGTVLTARDAQRLGLTSADQVAAVRWVPSTGQTLELYVAPAWRRRRIATALLCLAEGVTVARGWPRLHAGGLRTALGERLVAGWRWGVGRIAALTATAPPMTPPDEDPAPAAEPPQR